MHLRTWACLAVCAALVGCGTVSDRCPSGYHVQSTLCLPN